MNTIITGILIIGTTIFPFISSPSSIDRNNAVIEKPQSQDSELVTGKYEVGDMVKCTAWSDGSYWEGCVVKVVKDVVYKVELEKVSVAGTFQLYLGKSDCTGQKKLSFEDGKGYNATRIWIHERCLD